MVCTSGIQPWINTHGRYVETVTDCGVHCGAPSTQLKVTGFKAFRSLSPACILVFSPAPSLYFCPSLPPVWHRQGPVGSVRYHLGLVLMIFLLTWRTLPSPFCLVGSSPLSFEAQFKLASLLFFVHPRPEACLACLAPVAQHPHYPHSLGNYQEFTAIPLFFYMFIFSWAKS